MTRANLYSIKSSTKLKIRAIYQIRKYTVEDQEKWNQFIASAKNATFLFDRRFMDYHSDRFTDYSLMIYKNQKLIAVLPANIAKRALFSHQGLSYGGLVLSKKIKFTEVLTVFKEVLRFLSSEGIQALHLKMLPKIYHRLPSDEVDYLLFIMKAKVTRKDLTTVIDVTHKLKIDSSNRLRGIKKGIKNNLVIKEVEDLDLFWNEVLIPNLEATHKAKPVHTAQEIQLLKNHFPNKIRQFNVYHNEKIVAGTTIFETEKVAHAQYISAHLDKQQLGSLDYLFNYLINERYSEKDYFDFGISNENSGEKVNEGLLSWKEGFGGRAIIHDFYEVKTENHTLLNDVLL